MDLMVVNVNPLMMHASNPVDETTRVVQSEMWNWEMNSEKKLRVEVVVGLSPPNLNNRELETEALEAAFVLFVDKPLTLQHSIETRQQSYQSEKAWWWILIGCQVFFDSQLFHV